MTGLPAPTILNGGHVDLSSRVQISTTIVASPTAATETAIASITISNSIQTPLGVIIIATAAATIGTSGVSGRLRVYHGTSSGTSIGDTGATTVVATDLYNETVIGFDNAPVLPGQVYTVTLTVGSAVAGSTVSQVRLVALVI
jgi:hypothetical protein